jgi:dihydropteroate synthase
MFDWSNSFKHRPPYIIGVLNVPPDSFSDGGKFSDPGEACKRADSLVKEGADIIEVGGESTRPGAKPVSAEEELERIGPVVKEFASSTYLSVDTYKASVARECLKNGARMINDISALRADSKMAATIEEYGAAAVLMYSKESGAHPHVTDSKKDFQDVVSEISQFLCERISYAVKCGIGKDRIIADPGMGRFISHDPKYSWELLRSFSELTKHGLEVPLLVATSRKGFLGRPLEERDPVSQLTSLFAVTQGASFVRTHNPKMMREFLDIWNNTRGVHIHG